MTCHFRYRVIFGASLTIVAFWAGGAVAQPAQKTGRLADGKAYRIDESGFRLTDHVAELEVTVDELRRQVITLENELAAKDHQGGKSNPATNTSMATDKNLPVEPTLPAARRSSGDDGHLVSSSLTACRNENAIMASEITKLRGQVAPSEPAVKATGATQACEAQVQPLRAQIAQLQHALMSGPSKERIEGQQEENRGLSDSVATLKTSLARNSAELENTIQALNKAQEELVARRSREEQLLAQIAGRSPEQSPTESPVELPVYSKQYQARASIDQPADVDTNDQLEKSSQEEPLSEELIRHARTDFNTALSSIQKLIGDRKALYDTVKAQRRDVSVSISRLATSSGESLDTLRSRVKTARISSEVAALKVGLSQIEKILTQDIALLKRLGSRS